MPPGRVVFGGGSRIRTHDAFAGMLDFKSSAIDHSAMPPRHLLKCSFSIWQSFAAVHGSEPSSVSDLCL